MFEDDYKELNESIKPDKATLDKIKSRGKRQKRRNPYAIISIAASLIFVFAFSFLLLKMPFTRNTDYVKTTSYDDIYRLAQKIRRDNDIESFFGVLEGLRFNQEKTMTDDAMMHAPESDNFSDTNVQVDGVMEADVIKTDGKYIYTLYKGAIYIVEADKGDLKEASKLAIDKGLSIIEFYITEDRLILLASDYTDSYYWRGNSDAKTKCLIYNITDRENPSLMNTLGQSGYYKNSRMVGNTLYLISSYSIYYNDITKDPESYIPKLYNDEDGNLISSDDIYFVPNPSYLTYSIITSLDVANPDKHIDTKTLLGSDGDLYASIENIYLTHYSYENNNAKTHIVRLSLNKGIIEVVATGMVPGGILNQFSMDEYNDHFRICTTNEGNNLYVLDLDLNIVGKIEGLAKGERIFSVRFTGDIGYFVTFLQVDPLYTVDLADPKNPTLLSELKIPGFSRYLHKFADDLLFGIGNDADEQTGWQQGLKLSMFDVSDKGQVYEKDLYLFDSVYYSDALFNHKAILINPTRNIIAFYADSSYYIFSYDRKEGFKREAALVVVDSYAYYDNIRGLYIGDYFYVSASNTITSYNLADFTFANKITYKD